MADKSIRKETKKPKKTDKKTSNTAVAATPKPIMTQPELIKKAKKPQ